MKVIILILIVYALALSVALARKRPHRKAVKPIAREWGNQLSILIIGATGGTGRQLVKQALELGHYVTALARKPAKLTIEHPKLRVIKRDVLDYESVESAMRGQNAVSFGLASRAPTLPISC
jgi:FlaA1/EpsC-like NDP-sugar epimerase